MNSSSNAMLKQVENEFNSIDFTSIRANMEEYFSSLIKLGVLSNDAYRNVAIKAKIIDAFMLAHKLDYVKYGRVVPSMFENVVKSHMLEIPQHSKVDLNKYFTTGLVKVLNNDDAEYLFQALMLMLM